MAPKISAKTGILRPLRKIVPTDTLKHLYNAIVQHHFDYGDVVYHSASITSKTRLQKVQSRAARLISGSGPRQNRNAMLKELGSLQQRRDFHKCVFMYKCLNGLAPQYLCEMFTSNSHSYNIRNASQPKPPKARTAYYQCSVSVSGLKLWNSLPQDIQNSQFVASFKKSLHKYLSQTTILRILCFYSSVYFMYIMITFYLFYYYYFPMYKCKYMLYDSYVNDA